MDWLASLASPDGKLLGIDWSVWKIVGWLGNFVFFSRFVVQWYETEKRGRVVVPAASGVFSALGIAAGERRRDEVRSVMRPLAGLSARLLVSALER